IVEQQRQIAERASSGVVLEGRDIGTVVFPNARLKVFLTASTEERARRRVEELRGKGIQVDAGETLAELIERDARDSSRETSPLTIARDAVPVDTDRLSPDEVVARILALWRDALRGSASEP
ncbi:MAG TPA: (d)CMP kinase, partial [Chthonomonadaceae bacterium]|nr:(d)CMP kinase [Chthonomonadaceae bacterium]